MLPPNMSTRKGDNKKKAQKYQNVTTFKNNLHDTSKTTKAINNLVVQGVCERCRDIIEWKKKYKKYKPLTAPRKCVKCGQKTVKHAYHTICMKCAVEHGVCEKCGSKGEEIERSKGTDAEQAAKESQMQSEIKHLTERQRRTFFRALERGNLTEEDLDTDGESNEQDEDTVSTEETSIT
ncbi:uncharacterized protein C9orf85 homolog [Dendronephthya gigantea]|uniref:uncharacterized protein C9orf85 homolog n=1 Tax=Dendronephthya gigantea TaxID=151771 RepID=UPI0010699FED|nr:uncharacterized protein C9orf85 homolog [Dendronephthya gigantea]